MKITAVIVTYNASEWIIKCLKSIKESSVSMEIIIIDNNSSDDTLTLVNTNFSDIKVIPLEKNAGFGFANNIGIEYGLENSSDYFLLLNQDAWVEKDTVKNLISVHQKNDSFGILSPVHLNGDGTEIDYNFSNYIEPKKCENLYSDLYTKNLKDVYELPFVNAAIWLVSKACIKQVGLFSPLFFHYGEDDNYCRRVKYHQLKIGVCPSEIAYHDRNGRKGIPKSYAGGVGYRRARVIWLTDINEPNFNYIHHHIMMRIIIQMIKSVFNFNRDSFKTSLADLKYFSKNKNQFLIERLNMQQPYIKNN